MGKQEKGEDHAEDRENVRLVARFEDAEAYLSSDFSDDGLAAFEIETSSIAQPTARWYTACFHTVCAMVGAGVLGLPYSFSWLGWGGGLTALTLCCAASIYTSYLLAVLHEGRAGARRNTYRELGEAVLGRRWGRYAVLPVQYSLMVGLCVAYSVTAGQSVKGMVDPGCHGADCHRGLAGWIAAFGALQLALSQVPDFSALWWVSAVGALMSVGYSTIAAVLSGAEAFERAAAGAPAPHSQRAGASGAARLFGTFNALGAVAFTFGGQAVMPEIQATLARPAGPGGSTVRPMMLGVGAAYIVVVLAYYGVAVAGYAAYGDWVEPDVLMDTTHPAWASLAANVMVVVHVAAGYQVFAMPLFEAAEASLRRRLRAPPRAATLRLLLRSAYVLLVTATACLVPFFGDLMGLISSTGLMPVTFILPCAMWVVAKRPRGLELAANVGIAGAATLVAVLSLVGSARNILVHSKDYLDPSD